MICCYACLKRVYDMSALDLYMSVPQIPLLTAVLMFLIYKVLTSINKPLWCCWDMLLSPFSRRRCWECLVICWDHCRWWTKLGIELAACNSQPRTARAAAQRSGGIWLNAAIFQGFRMLPRLPSQHKGFSYHLPDQTPIENMVCLQEWALACSGKGSQRKICICPGSQSCWMSQGELLCQDSRNLNDCSLEKEGFFHLLSPKCSKSWFLADLKILRMPLQSREPEPVHINIDALGVCMPVSWQMNQFLNLKLVSCHFWLWVRLFGFVFFSSWFYCASFP